MAQGSGSRSRRARVLLAIVGVVAAAAILGGGLLVGTGGLGFLIEPTPEILYVTYPPGPTATPGHGGSASPTASATASPDASPDASPTGSPGASPTATPTALPATPTPALANLKVESLTYGQFHCGEAVWVGLWVVNNGPVATTGAAVLQVTDTFGGHEAYRTTGTIPILAPGAMERVEFTITLNSGCNSDHVMIFHIDPGNLVPESSKLDNVFTHPHHVGPAGPNLRIAYIAVDWAHPECAVAFNVTVRISNVGSLVAVASNFRLVDRVGTSELAVKVASVPALAANSSAGVTVHLTVMSHCGETHQIYVMADYGDHVDETHEEDNTATHSYLLYS
jgi:subtilase family serine protease